MKKKTKAIRIAENSYDYLVAVSLKDRRGMGVTLDLILEEHKNATKKRKRKKKV